MEGEEEEEEDAAAAAAAAKPGWPRSAEGEKRDIGLEIKKCV